METLPKPFQRIDSISNSHAGAEFENAIAKYWERDLIDLERNFKLEIGQFGRNPKLRAFDLGSSNPKIVVECKSHRWTSGGNSPSAKLTVWNESMYYFSLVPKEYRKIFCVLYDVRSLRGKVESLAQYYVRLYAHLIPSDVEVWEFESTGSNAKQLEIC